MSTKKKLPQKIKITVQVDSMSGYELEGKLEATIERLQTLAKEYGNDAYLNWHPDGYDRYSESAGFTITQDRLETDEEFDKRTRDEFARISAQEERDRREFERLKEKFEGKT